ncbi:uncharacterized protein ARMOST_08903 [Armillaria ostoyae]|uniref:Zn(2)-C6 fungal-type domain-containing protein n=1 Tax=Armillaria ostoyae TaxID=47428 RepID=A0A284R9Y6_ARMOS|nr:uncharacterized protein ARMOST_08903 [Armillaria ostoyae]
MLSQHQAPKKDPFFYLSQRQPGAIYDPNTLYSQYYSGSCTAEGEPFLSSMSASLSSFAQTQKEDDERFYATFPEARRAAFQNQWAMTPMHEEHGYFHGLIGFTYRSQAGIKYMSSDPCSSAQLWSPGVELEVAADDPDQRPSHNTAARLRLNYDYSLDPNGEASAPPESLASSPPEGPPQSPDYGSCYSEQARSDCSPTQSSPDNRNFYVSPVTVFAHPDRQMFLEAQGSPSGSHHCQPKEEPIMDYLASPSPTPNPHLVVASPDDSDPAAELAHISYPLPHSSPQADSEHASLPSLPSRSLPPNSQVIQIPSRKTPRRHTTSDDHTSGPSRGPFYYKIPLRQPRHSPTPPPFTRRPPAQSIARNNGDRKPPLACFFCRGRKIACGAPEPDNPDRTCNQCHRRSLKCEYPKESRRGMRKKKADGTGDTEAADKQHSSPVT